MRVAHLTPLAEGLKIGLGAGSDGGAHNPPHLAGRKPRLLNADLTYHVILADKFRQTNTSQLLIEPFSICYYAGNPILECWHSDCFYYSASGNQRGESNLILPENPDHLLKLTPPSIAVY
jgi:hypothetical protein